MNGPKVFADGTLTIVVGSEPWPDSVQVWVGTHKLEKFQAVRLESGSVRQTAGEMTFPSRTGKEEIDLQTEQEARLLSMFKWLRIRWG